MSNEQIPLYVIKALAKVRESGAINMFDRDGAIQIIRISDDHEAAMWLFENMPRYMDALHEMVAYITDEDAYLDSRWDSYINEQEREHLESEAYGSDDNSQPPDTRAPETRIPSRFAQSAARQDASERKCEACHGTGYLVSGDIAGTCGACSGTGVVRQPTSEPNNDYSDDDRETLRRDFERQIYRFTYDADGQFPSEPSAAGTHPVYPPKEDKRRKGDVFRTVDELRAERDRLAAENAVLREAIRKLMHETIHAGERNECVYCGRVLDSLETNSMGHAPDCVWANAARALSESEE